MRTLRNGFGTPCEALLYCFLNTDELTPSFPFLCFADVHAVQLQGLGYAAPCTVCLFSCISELTRLSTILNVKRFFFFFKSLISPLLFDVCIYVMPERTRFGIPCETLSPFCLSRLLLSELSCARLRIRFLRPHNTFRHN